MTRTGTIHAAAALAALAAATALLLYVIRQYIRNMKTLSTHMHTSAYGKQFIKRHEGLRLEAYRDTAGTLTIGYGHTGGVNAGDVITRDEADLLFEADLAAHEPAVQALGVELTQGQFDALVSFAFNVGTAAFEGSTLRRKVLANPDDPDIALEFNRWTYAGGATSAGLAARRKDEARMYFNLA